MHGFHQGAQFPQHEHLHLTQALRIQPSSQTGGQFSGHVSDTIQQQFGYSQRQTGVQHLPLQYTNPQQQQPPSGHLTGECQGICKAEAKAIPYMPMIIVVVQPVLEFGAHVLHTSLHHILFRLNMGSMLLSVPRSLYISVQLYIAPNIYTQICT